MQSLALYVRKEWRDQRVGLLGLLVALPLLFAVVCVAGDGTAVLEEFLRPGVAAACGALVVFFGVGTDLVPREVRGTRVGFLARLPAGLGRAFAAKLVFFAATTLVVAGYAAGIALAASIFRTGAPPEAFLGPVEERSVLLAIGLALWIVAASTWVQQGALAIPTAAAVAALLCSPAWFFFGPHSVLEPTVAEFRAFAALCALGSCASAGAAFVHGRRFGADQSSRAVLAGAVVAVASLTPAWLWSAHRLYAAHHCDPNARGFWIEDVRLIADGRKAEIDGVLGVARETFTVDLQGVFARLATRARQYASLPAVIRDRRSRVWERAGRWLVQDGRTRVYELFDPATLEFLPADLCAADRVGPMLPDGRLLLARDGEIFTFDPDSSERTRIAISGGHASRVDWVFDPSQSSRVRALEPPFVVVCAGSRPCLARLDLEHHELVPALGSEASFLRFIALGQADSAIAVEDNQRLVRVKFGSDERAVLLPRAR